MMRPTLLVFAAAAAISACTKQTPEQQIVADAANALGGRSRVLAVKTLVIEGEGTNGNLGQDMTMDASTQAFVVTGYKRSVDLVNLRARTEQTRTPNFAYFQGPQAQKQVLGVDGDVGYNVAPNGNATRASNAAAKDRRADIYHHPLAIVRAGLDPGAKLTSPRSAGREQVVDITAANGMTFTLAIDAASKLPTRVVSMTDNANLGDVVIETSFDDYQDVGGLKLPKHITTKTDKYRTAELRVAKQTVDGDAGDLAAPAAASAPAIAGPPAPVVTAEEIAKGIWFLAGQSHHSVLVEFNDHLTLIEAPQNDTRKLAVIAKAKTLRPGKPLTEVVNTHHHFDHSGGVRAAVSEGLTVITHKANAAFFQDAVARPHLVVPNTLAKAAKPLKLVAVDEQLELKDRAMTMNLYHVTGNPHADTMLMAYFPRERILVEVDAFSPGAAVQPYAANLRRQRQQARSEGRPHRTAARHHRSVRRTAEDPVDHRRDRREPWHRRRDGAAGGERGYAVCVNYRQNRAAAEAVSTASPRPGARRWPSAPTSRRSGRRAAVRDRRRATRAADRAGQQRRHPRDADARRARSTRRGSQRIFATNVVGAFLCAREAVRRMSTAARRPRRRHRQRVVGRGAARCAGRVRGLRRVQGGDRNADDRPGARSRGRGHPRQRGPAGHHLHRDSRQRRRAGSRRSRQGRRCR